MHKAIIRKTIKTTFDEVQKDYQRLKYAFDNNLPVSNDEINTAFERYETAKKIREDLIVNNLSLVNNIASGYKKQLVVNNSSNFEDLISAGNVAIVNSSRFYDFSRKIQFSTYANTSIDRAIQLEKNWLNEDFSLSKSSLQDLFRIKAAINRFSKELKSCDDPCRLIANNTGLSDRVVKEYLIAISHHGDTFSIDSAIESLGSADSFEAHIEASSHDKPEDELMKKTNEVLLADMLNRLTNRERIILSMAYGLADNKKYSYSEIGDHLGISKQRVGVIIQECYKKLRNMEEFKSLYDK